MNESVELSSLDLRYESHRLRNNAWEARVLASMAERGIEKPLEGVDAPQGRFLLNGFKRYRCARSWRSPRCPMSRWPRMRRRAFCA